MSATKERRVQATAAGPFPPSASGPLATDVELDSLPPTLGLPRALDNLRFNVRQTEYLFRARRELGDTFGLTMRSFGDSAVVISHPDHVKTLFTSDVSLAPAMGGDSPLAPIVGPKSMFVANGPRHMRKRRLLLPPFHGEAVQRFVGLIADVVDHEIGTWPVGRPFALAPRMQAIALDVIMGAMFGIGGQARPGTPEHGLRRAIQAALHFSATPFGRIAEQLNTGRREPIGLLKAVLAYLDRYVYAVIANRRADDSREERDDLLSLLLRSETEDGDELTDEELRDELLTLVLVGHETTANSLAWTVERLLHTAGPYDRLRETVRSGDDPDGYVDATIDEGLRVRPVVPVVARKVTVPWQFGGYTVPADTSVLTSIMLLHHRHDLYPDPFAFRPERFVGRKGGTYTWIPFGGGVRRCLGAPLAMAELRMVLETIAGRTDLQAADPEPDHARHRNVSMIPARGVRVVQRTRPRRR